MILVFFYTNWCDICNKEFDLISKIFANDYQINKVNLEENRELARMYSVRTIPSLVAVNDEGNVEERIEGPRDEFQYINLKNSLEGDFQSIPPGVL